MSVAAGFARVVGLAEWDALPEESTRTWELVEGVVEVAAMPTPRHQLVGQRLAAALDVQLPDHLIALTDVEVLVVAPEPVTIRVPDVVVTSWALAESNPRRVPVADVLVAVEIASPSTASRDRVTKFAEYARAGIAHYWLMEPDPPVTLRALALDDGRYREVGGGTGTVELALPEPLTLDLEATLRRR